jgi:exopolysaccharide production protein ExoZ
MPLQISNSKNKSQVQRLHSLDYLRGASAFSIMLYHYLSWTTGNFTSEDVLGRIGIYGVSVFYILSGLTLYHVYNDELRFTKTDIFQFFKKRFFRILPLLWLVTIISILLNKHQFDLSKLLLNLTGLFGFFEWNNYYSTGAWSIGNELVFYAFFPVVIFFLKTQKWSLSILILIIFSIYLLFAYSILDPSETLSSQWRNYVNPLNQIFLFLAGILIGLIFKSIKTPSSLIYILLIAGIGIFVFTPVIGNPIQLVTNTTRLIFTISCCFICTSFYKLPIELPLFIHKPLSLLGEFSYSLYLLHPIIFTLLNKYIFSLHYFTNCSSLFKLAICIGFSVLISYFVYEKFEKYFIALGKRTF